MKKILVPIDFTDASLSGLQSAVNWTQQYGGQISLVCFVLPHSDIQDLHPKDAILGISDSRHFKDLAEAGNHVLEDLESLMKAHVPKHLRGSTYSVEDSITELWEMVMHQINPDLIICGTSQERNFIEIFTGTEIENIIRNSDVPVLTVSHNDGLKIKNVLLATDVGNTLPHKLINICKLLQANGAKIHLVNFINSHLITKEEIIIKLDKMAQELGFTNYAIHVKSHDGIADEILKMRTQLNADIILMKTYEKSLFWQIFQSSLAEEIVRNAGVPAMIEKVTGNQ